MTTADNGNGDALTAVILRITELAERLAILEDREASTTGQVAVVVGNQERLLDSLGDLNKQVAAIAAKLQQAHAERGSDTGNRDVHGDPPHWWRLEGDDRKRAVARLRAWIDQVYRPGYGYVAASLAPCWDQHPLCIFGLHWLMELWSELYITGPKQIPDYASQAEWQTRLLPALAEQIRLETSRCQHARTRLTNPSLRT